MSASNPTQQSPSVQSADGFAENIEGGERGFQYLMANQEGRAELMANSSLQKDEWEQLRDTVVEVRKQDLSIVNDMRSSGLTRSMDLSTMTSIWQKVSHVPDEVNVGMNPGTRTDTDDVQYSTDGVPLPVIDMDWHIDRRMLLVSRNQGQGLDTIVPAQLTRLVNEKLEDLAVNGWNTTIDGRQMYGFRNHPNRGQFTAPGSWSDDTTDADDIRTTFLNAIETLEDDEYSPPYRVYLNRSEYQTLRATIADMSGGDTSDTNMRERISEEFSMEIDSIGVSPKIPSGEMVVFKPTPDVATLGVAEDVQAVEWREPDGWTHHFKVLASMNIELKDTDENQTGFAHGTGL